jgi:hypothetical protein
MRYWINTVSRDHVQTGVEGGFTQADHGKQSRLKRLGKGDRIAFYSPRTDQKFTAIGEVIDEVPYEAETGWRRSMRFFSAEDAPIQPLIEQLEFITNKKSWGFPFRRGLFEIGESDFTAIARAMRTLE